MEQPRPLLGRRTGAIERLDLRSPEASKCSFVEESSLSKREGTTPSSVVVFGRSLKNPMEKSVDTSSVSDLKTAKSFTNTDDESVFLRRGKVVKVT